MVHLSEDSQRLAIIASRAQNEAQFLEALQEFDDVCFLRLPIPNEHHENTVLQNIESLMVKVVAQLGENATFIVFGDIVDLVHVHAAISHLLRYQLWIAIKQISPQLSSNTALPHHHIGALVYTCYDRQLQHTKTRLEYTYCPACNKTTKDYGGKKHTYHPYGTLISDIWRDITVDPNGDISGVLERFADLFGIADYHELRTFDLSALLFNRVSIKKPVVVTYAHSEILQNQLVNGDCLDELRKLPSNSVDFIFADPPYNLKKEYRGYADDLSISDYFAWCDAWISEIARILRPGGTFALLNIPLWAIRHFLHLETVLEFQNWIVWDALSFPVRMIMPAHYAILCFSKGAARPLPGLVGNSEDIYPKNSSAIFRPLAPLEDGYCLRAICVADRARRKVDDRGILSDIWWDIHRLKHNSRRVDHPCQLPPQLMYRLITLFTEPGEVVLDCFNGAGTTTLAAHQLGRRYIGIERERKYYEIALERHEEIRQGLDPFRKMERELTAKNSPVARLKKQKYRVSKKTLQLEVRRVAQLLGRLPTREDVIKHGQFSIHYYDEYFTSWGEVCAAARTTGMTEMRDQDYPEGTYSQKRLF